MTVSHSPSKNLLWTNGLSRTRRKKANSLNLRKGKSTQNTWALRQNGENTRPGVALAQISFKSWSQHICYNHPSKHPSNPSFSTFLSPPCNLLPTIQREGREKSTSRTALKLTILPRSRLAPYERRVIELLRNSKDKRARKLAKKRVSPSLLFVPVHAYFRSSIAVMGIWCSCWCGNL